MATNITELCTLLVEDYYGDLSARVFGTLAQWGRIPFRTIVQHSDLPAKHVYHGLAVLIQQHLVLHHTPAASPSHYEVDWRGAYNLIRSGKVISVVEGRFGTQASLAVSSLLQLGHARVSDLEHAFGFDDESTTTTGTGKSEGQPLGKEEDENAIQSRNGLHSILYELLKAQYICKVQPQSYQPAADKQNEIEEHVKRQEFPDGKTTGPKAKIRFAAAILNHKRKQRDDEEGYEEHIKYDGKRRKMNGMMSGQRQARSGDDHGVTLSGDLVLRVNFEKCAVAMRSDRLVQHAQRFFGDTTSKIYEATLHLLERETHRCVALVSTEVVDDDDAPPDEGPRISALSVLETLEADPETLRSLDLELGETRLTNGHDYKPGKKKTRPEDCSMETSSGTSRNNMIHQINAHLLLLAEHPLSFTRRLSSAGGGEYGVPFAELSVALKAAEIDSVISSRYGTFAARMVRLLKEKGKLDEKQMCAYAFLRLRDVRTVLDEMHESGFLESQEIPKDNTRTPSRAVYLWFFDQTRVEKLVLERCYKSMSRCLQRVKVQRDKVGEIIAKAERTDVVGREEELLTKNDREHLRTWREQEAKLLCQVMRMDEEVALLRDY